MSGRHPSGIQPEGNMLLKPGAHNCRSPGLGQLHCLSDALVLDVLGHLEAQDLARLSCCSKSCYCFCDHEDLWKAAVIEAFQGGFTWRGSWRASYVASRQGAAAGTSTAAAPVTEDSSPAPVDRPRKRSKKAAGTLTCPVPKPPPRPIRVTDFYSDLLYQPWHCATVELQPEWLEVDNVDRRSGLTAAEFRAQYEQRNLPVVLTDGAAQWPALNKWTIPYLREAYGDRPVIAGDFEMPFPTYLSYAQNTYDEMPLYLFDKAFASAASGLAQDFTVPRVFREDLFSVLGDSRPDYRWLIAGPPRSGSSFHIDPNATSAWNGVVTGAKKWILYPPGVTPPGVHPSADGADVATPVSLLEWFINFYSCTQEGKVRPLETICRPGEVMFVPRGWWHACINLDWTVAVTQNFVSSVNLKHVLDFLRPGRADLVSGCALSDRGNLHDRFLAALQQKHPELLKALEAERQEAERRVAESKKLTSLFKSCGPTAGTEFKFSLAPNVEAAGRSADDARVNSGGTVPQQPAAGFSFGFKV